MEIAKRTVLEANVTGAYSTPGKRVPSWCVAQELWYRWSKGPPESAGTKPLAQVSPTPCSEPCCQMTTSKTGFLGF